MNTMKRTLTLLVVLFTAINLNAAVSDIVINEFMAGNSSVLADEFGEYDDWIELYNSGDEAVNIGGMYLTDSLGNPYLWQIPDDDATKTTIPAKGYLVLWADGDTLQGVLHLGFKLEVKGEEIGLATKEGLFIEELLYDKQYANVSFGRLPDGSDTWDFTSPTPGEANKKSDPVSQLYINEIMATNTTTLADELGEFDDWIEIYNAGSSAVDIGGMFITDDFSKPTMHQIPNTQPDSTTIQPGEYLLLWADNDPEQGVLHIDLRISGEGEQLALINTDGTNIIDSISFSSQLSDFSFGRFTDGQDSWKIMAHPTPGSKNDYSGSVTKTIRQTNVKFYPNPVANYLTIENNQNIERVVVFDMSGRMVKNVKNLSSNKITLNMDDLAAGTFLLQVVYGEEVVHCKVCKE